MESQEKNDQAEDTKSPCIRTLVVEIEQVKKKQRTSREKTCEMLNSLASRVRKAKEDISVLSAESDEESAFCFFFRY